MKKVNQFNLIKGSFASADASKILLEIVQNKIEYHNRHIFSIRERFNGDTSHSEKRIKELTKIGTSIKKLFAEVEKKGLLVEISCPITVKVKAPAKGAAKKSRKKVK